MRITDRSREAYEMLVSEVADYARSTAGHRACMGLYDDLLVVASGVSGEVYVIADGDVLPDDCEVYARLTGAFARYRGLIWDGLRAAPLYVAVPLESRPSRRSA